jgi:chaperonin GroES
MSAQLKPLYDRVLVKRISSEDKTSGGLFIPDSAKEKPLEGEIVAVGSGKVLDNGTLRPVAVKPGDRVLFAKYAETEIKLNNESFLLLKEDDLLGVINS